MQVSPFTIYRMLRRGELALANKSSRRTGPKPPPLAKPPSKWERLALASRGSSRGSRSKSGEVPSPALLSESVVEERRVEHRARRLSVEPIVKLDLYRQQV
jgi:hypothetical protein